MTIKDIKKYFDNLGVNNKLLINHYTDIFRYNTDTQKFYIVFEFIDNVGDEFTLKMNDDEFFHALSKYNCWTVNDIETFEEFINDLYYYMLSKKHEYNRILNAIYSNYSPIENVDEYTTETTEKRGTVGNVSNGSFTTGERDAIATDNNVTSTGYVSVFDNANDVQNNRNVASGGTTTHSNSATDTSNASNTETYNTDDTLTRRRHGNIGVTKSTELANDEIMFRLNVNFYDVVVFGYVNYSCYLCEGV